MAVNAPNRDPWDTQGLRKARGAFFTPSTIASYIVDWAVETPQDKVLEPSTGDAEFLVHAVDRLIALGADSPTVHGSELHAWSAEEGRRRIAAAGGQADITVGDFFERPVEPILTPSSETRPTSGSRTSLAISASARGQLPCAGA